MTQAVAKIMEEAERLSVVERAELADLMVVSLSHDLPEDIAQSQLSEVRRRIAEVESGQIGLIPGETALEHVRQMVSDARLAR